MALIERKVAWDGPIGPHQEILWVDVQMLDALWRGSPIYIGPGGEGSYQLRYSQIGEMIMAGNAVKMPEIGGDAFFRAMAYIAFINGTHRFSWIRDHGSVATPILIDREYCIELKQRLSTTKRICRVRYEG
jgi:hypothetical protein